MGGCSVFMAASRSAYKDVGVLRPGADRSVVLKELGPPDASTRLENGAYIDLYRLDPKAHRAGTKRAFAVGHLILDIGTLGLWELVGTPIELALRDKPMPFILKYDPAGKLLQVETEAGGAPSEKHERLVIAIRYPEDGARVIREASMVAALVTSGQGVTGVQVTLNGSQIHQQSETTPQKAVLVALPVTLREGANTIAVRATETDGATRQEIRTVVYERPAIAMSAPLAPPVSTALWAVVVGVGRYENPGIPRLRYTLADARAVYDTLIGLTGFSKQNILLLTDETERKPTTRNLRWALGTFLARNARKDDTVVIFYAGHGASEIDPSGLERDGFAKYLVPIDADPDDLYSTALPMDELQTVFNRIEAERVIAFLDTCYSGAAGGRTFASKRTRATQVDDLFLERLTRSKGRALVTASRTNEVSIELPELGHGLFTYHLVQGLRGGADLDRDGIVTLQELYQLVEREVSQHSRQVGANQHPVLKGEIEGVFPLVKVPR